MCRKLGMERIDLSDAALRQDALVDPLPQLGIRGITTVGDDLWLSTSNGRVMIVGR